MNRLLVMVMMLIFVWPPIQEFPATCDYCHEYPGYTYYSDEWLCEWCEMHLVPPRKD